MLQDLPFELLHAIIQHVDDRHMLKSLRLVSRGIRDEVDPFVYRTVCLRSDAKLSFEQRLTLFSERVRAPESRIASHVRHLLLRPWSSSLPLKPEILGNLTQVITRLCNLVSFKFECRASCFSKPCPIFDVVSSGCMPLTLRHFIWDHYDSPDAFNVVLNRQEHTERLDLPWFERPLQVSPQTLPRLRILCSGVDTALSLLPGRYVTHLNAHLLKDGCKPGSDGDGFQRISVFAGTGSWFAAAALASRMPALECLQLSVYYANEPWFVSLSHLVRNLGSTQLRCIHVTGYHHNTNLDAASLSVKECFDALPTLQWVQVRNPHDTAHRIFERWVRGALDSPKTIQLDAEWDWVDGWNSGFEQLFELVGVPED